MALFEGMLSATVRGALSWWRGEMARETAIMERQRAEAYKRAMRSMTRTMAMQEGLRRSVHTVRRDAIRPPSTWSGGLIVLVLLILAGCMEPTVFVESRMPIIEQPERPELVDTVSPWTDRELSILSYTSQLEALIQLYNDYAMQHNAEYGYVECDSVGDTEEGEGMVMTIEP